MGKAETKAKELCAQMTLEEKVSQLRYDAPAIERLGIPEYNWWNEGLHGMARSGTATVFPQAIGLAATFDDALVQKVAEVTSTETRAKYNMYSQLDDRDIYKGLTLWAPNINIFRDPRWGRGQETYGEDPYLTARMGIAYVKGLQGEGDILRTAACAKHFAVHSGPESVRHSFDAKVSEYDLEMTYLPAFEALVKEAKVESVMGAYNRVNGEAACASTYLQNKLHSWGFDGYFVSDCWAIQDFHMNHGLTETPAESAALALNNGCDVNCGCSYQYLLAAIANDLVGEDKVDSACYHLMRTRARLGMFDETTPYDDIPYTCVSSPMHKAISLEAARRSMVLLENNGILPLNDRHVHTMTVVGPNSTSIACLEGNYNGFADHYVTFLEGIQERCQGRVLYAMGSHLYKDRHSGLAKAGDTYAEAMICAMQSDVVVACVGLDPTIEGEEGDTGNEFSSGDKASLRLPESQRILLEKLRSTGKPLIVVCAAGSNVNLDFTPDALIQAWYPGSEGGTALAEILFGDIAPSGKLPVTFYKDETKLPDFMDYDMTGRTYRYTSDNVRYPFGYGLTYSSVETIGLEVEGMTATITVKNTGDRLQEDVVQLYIKGEAAEEREQYRLCGFARVKLTAGEEQKVVLTIPDKALTCANADGIRAKYATKFVLFAGTQQPDATSVHLTGKTVLTKIVEF